MSKWLHSFIRALLICGSYSIAWQCGRPFISRDIKWAKYIKKLITLEMLMFLFKTSIVLIVTIMLTYEALNNIHNNFRNKQNDYNQTKSF